MLADGVADGKRVEHPLFELVLVDVFRIGYIIEVTANFLAVYHNSELLIYRVTPAVECGTVELVSVTEIFIPRPAVGKILMGNLTGMTDCVD